MKSETKLVNSEFTAYIHLANAIVAQAAREYAAAISSDDEKQIFLLERFFHSGWYALLTNLDADFLMRKIRKCGTRRKNWDGVCQ